MGNTSYRIIAAGDLTAWHIGELIRFRLWDATSEVAQVITAELRQISHDQGNTCIHYGSNAVGYASLDPDQPITRNPQPDYADVATLAGYDEDAATEGYGRV
jgi:hypothetical protein